MILAINTCLRSVEVALIDNGRIIKEVTQPSERDHAEQIFNFLEEFLKSDIESSESRPNIEKVVVVTGPGPFTSIRVGVVTANTIAYASQAAIYAIDLNTLFDQEVEKTAVFISAGKSEIYELRRVFIKYDADEFLKNRSEAFYGSLTSEHIEGLKDQSLFKERTKTLGEAVLSLMEGDLEEYKVDQALPVYLKPPNISVSKKGY